MDAKLQRMINKIHASIPREEDLSAAMINQIGRIRNRTLAGRDVNGFPFLRKKDGSASTLTHTGLLLRSLQARSSQAERGLVGRISVTGRARTYAPFVNAKRPFLGASPDEKMSVVHDIRAAMDQRRRDA